jgi:hypothetical protein
LSNSEQDAQMEVLRREAIRTPNPYQGIKAIEELAAYGEVSIPKLLEVGNDDSIADTRVKQAALSEIERIKKKGVKH